MVVPLLVDIPPAWNPNDILKDTMPAAYVLYIGKEKKAFTEEQLRAAQHKVLKSTDLGPHKSLIDAMISAVICDRDANGEVRKAG